MRRRHPFLDTAGPVAIAHRGGAGSAPENTEPAFAEAVAMGYRYLETDVHVTRDGVVVAFHDPTLDRVTDCRGRIADLTIAEVERADAGFHFSPDGGATRPFRGQGIHVPRLATLLTAFPECRWTIDIKSDAAVAPALRCIDELNAYARVCIGGFSDARLQRVRAEAGERICTSMGPQEVARFRVAAALHRGRPQAADLMQVPMKSRGIQLVTRQVIRTAHVLGLPVHVWTIDDLATMNALLDMGVDGIMTDRIAMLRDVMWRHGHAIDGSGRLTLLRAPR